MLKGVLLRGFRSIESQELTLGSINVLIGANGAGKSSLVSFFRLMAALARRNLQVHVGRAGGAGGLLHRGARTTPKIVAGLRFITEERLTLYGFTLSFSEGDRLVFESEAVFHPPDMADNLGGGHFESNLQTVSGRAPLAASVLKRLEGMGVYHFHDTSPDAPMRGLVDVESGATLRPRGENLAAFLYRLRRNHREDHDRIVEAVRGIAPFFRDFVLEPSALNPEKIQLRWMPVDSEYDLGPQQLSDGTLRFIALASVLLQPESERPRLVVIDEPEIGLHPLAIQALADMVHDAAAASTQVILSTQSTTLLDQFEADDVMTVELEEGQSVFRRQTRERLGKWLEGHSLSELWEKNVMGGRPYPH